MYKAVIFDLDGTLVNSIDDLAASVNYALAKYKLPTHSVEKIKSFVGNGADVLIKKAVGERQDYYSAVHAAFKENYKRNMCNKTKPYDGIITVLDKLKDMDIKTAVVSNKPNYATKEIVKNYFGDKIDCAIGALPQIRKKKPSPDAVYLALDTLRVMKSEAVYIGDSDVDITTAKNSGLKSIGVTWGFRSADTLAGANYFADKPEDIVSILEKEI
jgi:phosphoglycolate phosphatase